MSLDTTALRRLGLDLADFHKIFQVFFDELNRCGGVNGRKLVLKSALYNLTAPDISGHLQALCLKVREDQKAFMAVQLGGPAAAARCVAVLGKTIFDAPAYPTEADFLNSKGRVVSLYGSGEALAEAFVKDGIREGTFKGKKVTVLGSTLLGPQATGEMRQQYIAAFKEAGIDADLEMLPCVGSSCVGSIASVVQRMKARGTDVIVLSTSLNGTANFGPILREVKNQGLKVTFAGPTFNVLHQDSGMDAIVAAAGDDVMRWVDDVGLYSVGADKIGEWRSGKVRDSQFAKMCQAVYAKAVGQAQPFQFIERDISNSRWGAVASTCAEVRAIARALLSLGNNVTTERMVAALKTVKIDRRDNGPNPIDFAFYSGSNNKPPKVATLRLRYPCPLPSPRPAKPTACMMPVDSPMRFRPVRY